jgi:uncharacterized repeat protein (TIGR03806 family)
MKKFAVLLFCIPSIVAFFSFRSNISVERKETLSAYGFFSGELAKLNPVEGVVPYNLNTPLFSNYAEKLRFIKLPEGAQASYNDTAVFTFPIGTVLIKNFYYPNDFRKPDKGRKILETRLLVNTDSGWEAWPYLWNDEQTEAFYDPAGEIKTITYVDRAGKKITTPYAIPNKNQCKGCHIKNKIMMPIGLSARQLNADFVFASGKQNQLKYWKEKGMLEGLNDTQASPKMAVWDDATTGNVNDRARAYLDSNCAHCHSKAGPANTSGLFLDIYEKDPTRLGVNKAPVAAGRGAGNLQFDIVQGQPQHSILVYRMKAIDPAIAMPEIGREQVHKEGVALIEEWIRKNTF